MSCTVSLCKYWFWIGANKTKNGACAESLIVLGSQTVSMPDTQRKQIEKYCYVFYGWGQGKLGDIVL